MAWEGRKNKQKNQKQNEIRAHSLCLSAEPACLSTTPHPGHFPPLLPAPPQALLHFSPSSSRSGPLSSIRGMLQEAPLDTPGFLSLPLYVESPQNAHPAASTLHPHPSCHQHQTGRLGGSSQPGCPVCHPAAEPNRCAESSLLPMPSLWCLHANLRCYKRSATPTNTRQPKKQHPRDIKDAQH